MCYFRSLCVDDCFYAEIFLTKNLRTLAVAALEL